MRPKLGDCRAVACLVALAEDINNSMTLKEKTYPDYGLERKRLFDQIIDAGRAGQSHAQIAKRLEISRDTLEHWQAKHKEFADCLRQADDYALAWWEALGQRHAETREGNATMIMFVMKNRFEQDYGREAIAPETAPVDTAQLTELSPNTRSKLRKILNQEKLNSEPR